MTEPRTFAATQPEDSADAPAAEWVDVDAVDELSALEMDDVDLLPMVDVAGLKSEMLTPVQLSQRLSFIAGKLAEGQGVIAIAEEAFDMFGFTLRRTLLYVRAVRRSGIKLANDRDGMTERMAASLLHIIEATKDDKVKLQAIRELRELVEIKGRRAGVNDMSEEEYQAMILGTLAAMDDGLVTLPPRVVSDVVSEPEVEAKKKRKAKAKKKPAKKAGRKKKAAGASK